MFPSKGYVRKAAKNPPYVLPFSLPDITGKGINHCHIQCFWQEVILRSPVFETCSVLTLCAPKVAVIPDPWCKTKSVTAQRKIRSILIFLWVHVHSFFTSPVQTGKPRNFSCYTSHLGTYTR